MSGVLAVMLSAAKHLRALERERRSSPALAAQRVLTMEAQEAHHTSASSRLFANMSGVLEDVLSMLISKYLSVPLVLPITYDIIRKVSLQPFFTSCI